METKILLEMIRELIAQNSNDAELGKKIRMMFKRVDDIGL